MNIKDPFNFEIPLFLKSSFLITVISFIICIWLLFQIKYADVIEQEYDYVENKELLNNYIDINQDYIYCDNKCKKKNSIELRLNITSIYNAENYDVEKLEIFHDEELQSKALDREYEVHEILIPDKTYYVLVTNTERPLINTSSISIKAYSKTISLGNRFLKKLSNYFSLELGSTVSCVL